MHHSLTRNLNREEVKNLHKGLAYPIQDASGQALGSRFLHGLGNSSDLELELVRILRTNPGRFQTPSFEALSSAQQMGARQRFLAKLSFSEKDDRELNIVQAMKDTFDWIYRDPQPMSMPWTNFSEWLGQGTGIYWITGKAGSGKSTLMKFLNADPRTKEFLEEWCVGVPLYTAGFFFWNSGTEAQASYDSLLRSLLFGILSTNTSLIPQLFPDRWSVLSLFETDPEPWRATELLRAFRKLASPEYQTFRFFFFVDGLDEFSGDHGEIIAMLQEVAKCPHIKICVSSRPWVVFQDAFDTNPSLILQDLTRADIEHYIRTMFYGHSRFVQLEIRDPERAQQICKDVATKSSGVFLWVRLVVQSLLSGISNGDRISDLDARLDALPQDLEKLFHKMLMSIEAPDCPTYIEHTSQLFQIFRTADKIDIFKLSLADEHDERVLFEDSCNLTPEEMSWRIQDMTRRLNSRTKGLLEVENWSRLMVLTGSLLEISSTTEFKKRNKVQYLHRTVKDFIEKPDTWAWITGQCQSSFDPQVSLCKANLLEAKFMIHETHAGSSKIHDIEIYIERALRHSSSVRPQSYSTLAPLLDQLNILVIETSLASRGLKWKRDSPTKQRLAAMLSQISSLSSRGNPSASQKTHAPGQKRANQHGTREGTPTKIRKRSSSSCSTRRNCDT